MLNKDSNGFITLKIALIGSKNVGKTTIIHQILNKNENNQKIENEKKLNIDIYYKLISVEGEKINIQLWDVNQINDDINIYFGDINGVIFVYDLSSKLSYQNIISNIYNYKKICQDLKRKSYCLILGNKMDLNDKREIPFNDINSYSIKNKINYYEISAIDLEHNYNKILFYFDKLIREILYDNKILPRKKYYDLMKYKYLNYIQDDNVLLPSRIYKSIDIFVKNIYKLFPLEDFILQIINDINEFNKKNTLNKIVLKSFNELKNHIYDLEILKGRLLEIFKIVIIKYEIELNNIKTNINNQNENKEENNIANNNEILLEFIKCNELLIKAINYVIHDYLINFILDFNNEIILEKRLDMFIDKDINEELFINKYFCDYNNKKEKIYSLFNDKYTKYFCSSELNQYYIFIKEIDYLFDYLSNSISNKSVLDFLDKGEKSLNSLKDYYLAYNGKYEKVKNDKIKEMQKFEVYKKLIFYGKNAIKYYKYGMKISDLNYLNKKDTLYNSIKSRLYLSIVYSSLDINFESFLYLYASCKLIQQYYNDKEEEELFVESNKGNCQMKEIIDLFNNLKEKICPDIKIESNHYKEDIFLEISKKLENKIYNSTNFYLFYNDKKAELIKKNQNQISNNTSSLNNLTNSLLSPQIILKIYKSSNIPLNNNKEDENKKIRIKLYEIYSDSIIYFKRKQYNMFFKCLSQKFNKNESLLFFDGKNINSLQINPSFINEILCKYEFIPDEIAQFYNILGIGLIYLYIKSSSNNEENLKLFKKQKKLAYNIFNTGLSDTLIEKAKEIDIKFKKIVNLNINENPYLNSLEQIRTCLRENICLISLFKEYNILNKIINSIKNSIYINNDFPINFPLYKLNEYIESIYLESYIIANNNNISNNTFSIKNYLPYSCIYTNLSNKNEFVYYINDFIEINNKNEYDLINVLNYYNNDNKINDFNFITEDNFKERFIKNNKEAKDENKALFSLIFILENVNNIDEWSNKFDIQKGKNIIFNSIYFDYLSKYYNFKIYLYIQNIYENNNNSLKIYKIIDLGNNSQKKEIYIFFDKDKNLALKIFFPLFKKEEIYIENNINNIELFLKNLNEKAKILLNNKNSHFAYFLYWKIIMIIKLILADEKSFENIDDNIIDIYLQSLFNLNLYENVIIFINEKIKNNCINTKIKMKTFYYILLFNCYKKLCLYNNCIDIIREYISVSNSISKIENIDNNNIIISKNIFNYDNILYILNLNDKNFNDIVKYYYENKDNDNQIKLNENNKKIKILCIEGFGIYSLIQIIFLCEIEKHLKISVSKLFDYFICSKEALFIVGLLMIKNDNGENKYSSLDILKLFKENINILFNDKIDKNEKINIFKKIFDKTKLNENAFYCLNNDNAPIKITQSETIIDLYSKYLNMNINDLNEPYITFDCILKIINGFNYNSNDIYVMNLSGGNYPININEKESKQKFFFKTILGEKFLDLNIELNCCNDYKNYFIQNINEKFDELMNNLIEYFTEIKKNGKIEEFYKQLNDFFNVN